MATTSIPLRTTANVDGVELEYEVGGTGEPVVFIHGCIFAETMEPLASQACLSERYRLVTYHRRGFAGSTRSTSPVSVARQAADCLGLMDRLGIGRAHIAGHSYGGMIALQMALDAPERVHSIALLEAGAIRTEESDEAMAAFVPPIVQRYEEGDRAGAIEAFCRLVGGQDFRERIERVLGQAWMARAMQLAVADADTFFAAELQSLEDWTFTPEHASRIAQPVLSVLGEESGSVDPLAVLEHEALQAWMPQTEAFVLPGATHGLQLMNPADMAEGLAQFFRRHAMADTY